jgi:hypothetical protein
MYKMVIGLITPGATTACLTGIHKKEHYNIKET